MLRPLLGFNKDEIIRQAEAIGTASASSAVEEYCALLPRHPATRAVRSTLLAEDAKLDDGLLEQAFAGRRVHDLRSRSGPGETDLVIERVESGMTVLDLRSPTPFGSSTHPGALRLDYADALRSYRAFDRSRRYALVCEVGLKSAHLAEVMREEGFAPISSADLAGGCGRSRAYPRVRELGGPG